MAENEEENVPKKRNLDYILDNLVGGGSWYQWTTVFCMIPLMMSGEWPLTVRYTEMEQINSCMFEFSRPLSAH